MTLTKVKPTNSIFRDVFFPNQFGQLFDLVDQNINSAGVRADYFRPEVNVVENEAGYHIEVALPGISKEDIKIDLNGSELTISGGKTETNEETTSTHHVKEIVSGKFKRVFSLNELVDPDKIEAKSNNGILEITLPKLEKAQPKAIEIK